MLLVGGKEFLHQLKDTKVGFVVVGKPITALINTKIDDLLDEVLLGPGSATSEKLPYFEENSAEFEEPRSPSESQRVQRPSRTLQSANRGVEELRP